MNYEAKPDRLDELAAQYALGTLRGAARQRFEQLLARSSAARESLALWEALLQPMALLSEPISPPDAARAAVLDKAFRLRAPAPAGLLGEESTSGQRLLPVSPVSSAAPRPAPVRALRQRLQFLAAASVCGALLLFGALMLSGGRLSFPASPPSSVIASVESSAASSVDSSVDGVVRVGVGSSDTAQALPTVMARVGIPTSSMQWLISLSPDHRQLSIIASDDYTAIGRGSIQLWWLVGANAPKPLALLGTERDSTVMVDLPPGLDSGQTIVFAISIEPHGGSPTGQPTGPVLDRVLPSLPI